MQAACSAAKRQEPTPRPHLDEVAPRSHFNRAHRSATHSSLFVMTPAVLEASSSTAPAQTGTVRRTVTPSNDALLSLDQVADLLGKTLRGVRELTSVGLLKHQLIDGERCVRLGDLIAYKRDFDKRYAEYLKSPTSRIDDEMPNPFDVLPEYAQMLEP